MPQMGMKVIKKNGIQEKLYEPLVIYVMKIVSLKSNTMMKMTLQLSSCTMN